MSRLFRRMEQVQELLEGWTDRQPFPLYFKQCSRRHREWGSRDRKEILDLAYTLFRCGHCLPADLDIPRKLSLAIFLFSPDLRNWPEELLENNRLPGELFPRNTSVTGRLKQLKEWQPGITTVYPAPSRISEALDTERLTNQLAQESALFFRVRKTFTGKVETLLHDAGVTYSREGSCIRLPLGTDLSRILGKEMDQYGTVQDAASQEVVRGLEWTGKRVWDTCSASGGKALQLMEEYPGIRLTCSDIRPSILKNLELRFKESRLPLPEIQVVDLDKPGAFPPNSFDALLCDVPCSGSGTFRRNPDAMYRFSEKELADYSALQRAIVSNALPALREGGELLYATCSVYRDENEEQVAYLEARGMQLIASSYLDKSEEGGDILFRALFKKP